MVRRVPKNRYKDAGDADGDVPERVPADERMIELKGRRRWSSLKHVKERRGIAFGSRMRSDTDSSEVVEDVADGSEVSVDN